MEYYEADPLPECCQNCTEADEGYCDECDHLGERFVLSKEDQIMLQNVLEKRINERKLHKNGFGL